MTEAERKRIYRRKRRRKQMLIKRCITVGGVVLSVVLIITAFSRCTITPDNVGAEESVSESTATVTTTPVTATTTPEVTEADIWEYGDPNNSVYPYSIMSTDWGAEVYEQGFTYYEIPNSYKLEGGMFPEVAQVYLWCICREAGVDYYTALALIERESGYKWDATGDSGASKGLMQIQEKFHLERMEALGVDDLYNPYSNMRVGVNYLKEIQDKYLASSGAHCVLMVYNMGSSGARKCWAEGIYSTAYTKQILSRAQEIKQELQDQ